MDHTVLPANYTMPAFPSPDGASTECGGEHLIAAHYSIYRPREDERLSWPGWLTYIGRLTHISGQVTRQLRVEHRTAKQRWPETDVLPLSHAGQTL